MLHISQQLAIFLLLTFLKFILADVFAEHVAQEENQSLSDSVLTAAIDDINDNEVFRQYNTKPYFYPYLQQAEEHRDLSPTQRASTDANLRMSQQPQSSSLHHNLDEPRYFLSTDNDNRATVEVVEPSMMQGQKFDDIVEYLLEKLAREDQQIIDSIYNMLFDKDENTRPLENTTLEPPKQASRKCYVCKKDFKQQSQPKD